MELSATVLQLTFQFTTTKTSHHSTSILAAMARLDLLRVRYCGSVRDDTRASSLTRSRPWSSRNDAYSRPTVIARCKDARTHHKPESCRSVALLDVQPCWRTCKLDVVLEATLKFRKRKVAPWHPPRSTNPIW